MGIVITRCHFFFSGHGLRSRHVSNGSRSGFFVRSVWVATVSFRGGFAKFCIQPKKSGGNLQKMGVFWYTVSGWPPLKFYWESRARPKPPYYTHPLMGYPKIPAAFFCSLWFPRNSNAQFDILGALCLSTWLNTWLIGKFFFLKFYKAVVVTLIDYFLMRIPNIQFLFF